MNERRVREDYEFNNSYRKLEELVNIQLLGRVIAAGYNSVIIKPYNEYQEEGLSINDPIMVISLESQKYDFMRKLIGRKCKKVNLSKLDSDYAYLIKLIQDNDFSVFYMERFQEPQFFHSPSKALMKFFANVNNTFRDTIYTRYDLNYFMDEIKFLFKKNECKEKEVLKAIKKSFSALMKSGIDSNFGLDLHEKQFLRDNQGNLVCVDPVIFNFAELQKAFLMNK